MQEHYPKCFPPDASPQPLALGIHNQLLAIEDLPFSKTKMRKFLTRYTSSKDYCKALIVGNNRVDLTGYPTSKISEEEAKNVKRKNRQRTEQANSNDKNLPNTNFTKGIVLMLLEYSYELIPENQRPELVQLVSDNLKNGTEIMECIAQFYEAKNLEGFDKIAYKIKEMLLKGKPVNEVEKFAKTSISNLISKTVI